jgi:two-component system, NarL family, nitrate/nitrite response regulator NarL
MVDDHEVLREGVKSLLAKLGPDWQVCGEATNGQEAIQIARDLKPDLIVLDISMPRMSGLEASSEMRNQRLDIPVLIFTTHQSERLAQEVRQAGAQGYVLKSQAARDLILAIDTILKGGTFFGAPQESKPAPENKIKPAVLFRSGMFAFGT